MKPKDIVKHKKTGNIGFITCKRDDLKGNHYDVQFAFDLTGVTESAEFREIPLINGGCYEGNELEVLIPALNEIHN